MLKPTDLIAHCQARKAAGVQAATIGQDVSYLRGVIRDYVNSRSCRRRRSCAS
jgi:hypothetical protein